MTEDDCVVLWNNFRAERRWLAENAPHLAQYTEEHDTYNEICAVERKSILWHHTKIFVIVFIIFAVLVVLPDDRTKDSSNGGLIIGVAVVAFLTWLIMLPQALVMGRKNYHKIRMAEGTFTFTKPIGKTESSYSVPLAEIKWRTSSTKRDSWFKDVPHKERNCIVAELPLKVCGFRISRMQVACGLTAENRAVLDEFIRIPRPAVPNKCSHRTLDDRA